MLRDIQADRNLSTNRVLWPKPKTQNLSRLVSEPKPLNPKRIKKTPWFLVGNGGMDPPLKVPYSSPNNPFPHSLLRTKEKKAKPKQSSGLQVPDIFCGITPEGCPSDTNSFALT